MKPKNEKERLAALESYEILDTNPEKEFDRITKIASIICETPIALISLIDEERQWFKSKIGLTVNETPRYISFCQYAIMGDECFEVENAKIDMRFKDNPLVTQSPNISFYAGYPLKDENGFNLGTLCVIDNSPKVLSDNQKEALKLLAEEVVSNIVSRKKNSEAQKQAQLFDLSLELMCIADTDGHFIQVNKSWADILGYDIEALSGKSFLDFVHPDDIPATLDAMKQLEEQNAVINFTNRYQVKDGAYKLIEWNATPKGKLIYAIASDITEQEATKSKLNKVNEILKEAEKITKMGAWELDLATNITYWTDEVYAIHEVDKDFDHNKFNGIDFYHPDYRQQITDAITKSITHKVSFDEKCKFISAKGNEKWVRSTGHPVVEGGKVTKLFGVFIDVTEEHVANEQAKREKYRLASIIEGTNVGTWEWNIQTGETVFNDKWAEIIGYSLDELTPISIDTWMKFAHPDDLEESENALNLHFDKKNTYYHFESRMKHKSGDWIWVLDRGKVVSWTEDGKPLMMYGTHQDITHRKEIEYSLKSQNQLISSFYELSPIGLALNDFETGQFIQVNKSLLNSVGYTFDEFVLLSYFDLTPKKYYERETEMLESLKNTGGYGPFEKEYIHKDGHLVPVLLNGVLVTDVDGSKKIWSVIEDISDIKAKEHKIQKTLENLNDSQRISKLGSWEFDLTTNNLEWSEANYELFEIDKNIKGQKLYEIYQSCLNSEDLDELNRLVDKAISEGESYTVEQTITTAKGNTKQILGIGKYIKEENKSYLRGTAQDITALFKQRILNEMINELNRIAILRKDSKVFYEKILLDLLGVTESEYGFIGEVLFDSENQPYLKTYALTNIAWDDATRKFYDDHAPEGLEFRNLETLFGYALKHKEVVISNNPSSDKKRGGLPKGHPPLTAFLGIPILFNGELIGMVGIANKKQGYLMDDVKFLDPFIANLGTAFRAQKNELRRQDAEQQLLESKEKLESVFKEMSDAIWSINAEDFSLIFITPSVVDLYGYPISDWEKDTQLWIKVVHPDDQPIIDKCFEDLTNNGEFNREYRIYTKDGSLKWVKNRAKKVVEDNGRVRIDGAISDVSIEKENLFKVEEAKKIAEQASLAKDEFLANMSHEIRTPLNAIVGFSEMLENTPLTENQKKHIDVISVASKNLMNVLNDVLDTSKLEAGVIQLEKRKTNIKEVVENVVSLYASIAHAKKVKTSISIDSDVPKLVFADQTRLSQILSNLVNNAIKFTEKGKVALHVEVLSRQKDRKTLRFIVKDTGIGIPKNKQIEIFDRFIQAESSTTRKYGGTGLGMSIVKSLVALHNGEINLTSEEGKGTTITVDITFTIAAGKQIKQQSMQKMVINNQLFKGYTFLIVEDNKFNQLLVESILTQYGATLDFAGDGLEAIEKVKSNSYDLIIMDLQMPNMDGTQATKILIEELKIKTPIIACSAHSIKSEKEDCIALGMKDYIPKPFKKELLIDTISHYILNEKVYHTEPESSSSELLADNVETCLLRLKEENGVALLHAMVPIYLEHIPKDIQVISDNLIKKDWIELERIIHKLAGSLSSIYFTNGSHFAKEISADIKAAKLQGLEVRVLALKDYLIETVEQTKNIKL